MNQHVYHDTLEAKFFFWEYGIDASRVNFQHDNDPKHTTKLVKECFIQTTFQ